MVGDASRLDEVWLVSLDPTQGAEIQKIRPCLVVSPDEQPPPADLHFCSYDHRSETLSDPGCPHIPRQARAVALDQLRAMHRQRLVRKLGRISPKTAAVVSTLLVEMFTRPPT